MRQDQSILNMAAARLRWIGGFHLFLFGISLLGLILDLGVRRAVNQQTARVVICTIFLAIALTYLVAARYIVRGHHWAIMGGIGLIVLHLLVVVQGMIMLSNSLGWIIMYTLLLIADLNILKLLVLSWGAAARIQQRRADAILDVISLEPLEVIPVGKSKHSQR
jgi:hypothetical protein